MTAGRTNYHNKANRVENVERFCAWGSTRSVDQVARAFNISRDNARSIVERLIREGRCKPMDMSLPPPPPVVGKPRRTEFFSPRFGPGDRRMKGRPWSMTDEERLSVMVGMNVGYDMAADVLARPKSALWAQLALRRWQKPPHWTERRARQPLLSYPYVTRATSENRQVLEVNQLVARAFPEHMRADLCQDILLALLEGQASMEELRRDGIKAYVRGYRKKQNDPWNAVNLDAPRRDGANWHEVLSVEQLHPEYGCVDA